MARVTLGQLSDAHGEAVLQQTVLQPALLSLGAQLPQGESRDEPPPGTHALEKPGGHSLNPMNGTPRKTPRNCWSCWGIDIKDHWSMLP